MHINIYLKELSEINHMEQLQIYETTWERRRIGRPYDGGYVICMLPGGYDGIISGGVSDDVSFEQELLNHYPVPCFAYDGTVSSLPIQDSRITFINKNLGTEESNILTNLHSQIEPYSNLFMKMDIEGHEFRLLPTFSDAQMKKIKQLTVEIHTPGDIQLHPTYFKGLSDITHERMFDLFEQINRTHTLVHVHPNNGCSLHMVNNTPLPNVFECTFIRNDYVSEKKASRQIIPTDLDMPNIPHKPVIFFVGYPFIKA